MLGPDYIENFQLRGFGRQFGNYIIICSRFVRNREKRGDVEITGKTPVIILRKQFHKL